MALIKQLAGETVYYGISTILSRLLHFVVMTVYLSWKLSPRELGIFTDLYFYAAILLILFTYRMETAFFRFGSEKGKMSAAFSTALSSIMASTVIFVGLIVLFTPEISRVLRYPEYPHYIYIFAGIIGLDALTAIPFARLRLTNRPLQFALLKTLNVLITIGLVLFFLELYPRWFLPEFFFGISLYFDQIQLFLVFLSNFLASTFLLIMLLPQFRHFTWNWNGALRKKMLWYAMPLVLVGLAGVINQSSAVTLQKYILPNSLDINLARGGIYSVSAKLALLLNLFTIAFNYAAEPFFFNHARRSDAREIYGRVGLAFSMAASVVMLFILMYIDLIQMIIGKDFREGVEIIPILLVAFFMLGLYYNFSIWYKLKDKTHFGAFISIGGTLITLLISFVYLPRIGYIASAWAALACYTFMALACLAFGKKYYPIPYPIGKMLLFPGIAMLSYFFSEWLRITWHLEIWSVIGMNTGILIVVMVGLYWIFKREIKELIQT